MLLVCSYQISTEFQCISANTVESGSLVVTFLFYTEIPYQECTMKSF